MEEIDYNTKRELEKQYKERIEESEYKERLTLRKHTNYQPFYGLFEEKIDLYIDGEYQSKDVKNYLYYNEQYNIWDSKIPKEHMRSFIQHEERQFISKINKLDSDAEIIEFINIIFNKSSYCTNYRNKINWLYKTLNLVSSTNKEFHLDNTFKVKDPINGYFLEKYILHKIKVEHEISYYHHIKDEDLDGDDYQSLGYEVNPYAKITANEYKSKTLPALTIPLAIIILGRLGYIPSIEQREQSGQSIKRIKNEILIEYKWFQKYTSYNQEIRSIYERLREYYKNSNLENSPSYKNAINQSKKLTNKDLESYFNNLIQNGEWYEQ